MAPRGPIGYIRRRDACMCCCQAFDTILSSVNRSAWTPLYAELKDLICCSLTNDVRSIWISWTVAAASAGACDFRCVTELGSALLSMKVSAWHGRKSVIVHAGSCSQRNDCTFHHIWHVGLACRIVIDIDTVSDD